MCMKAKNVEVVEYWGCKPPIWIIKKDLANKIGVSRQTINAIEKGEYNPTIKLCLKICWALDTKLDELFWEDYYEEDQEE